MFETGKDLAEEVTQKVFAICNIARPHRHFGQGEWQAAELCDALLTLSSLSDDELIECKLSSIFGCEPDEVAEPFVALLCDASMVMIEYFTEDPNGSRGKELSGDGKGLPYETQAPFCEIHERVLAAWPDERSSSYKSIIGDFMCACSNRITRPIRYGHAQGWNSDVDNMEECEGMIAALAPLFTATQKVFQYLWERLKWAGEDC